MRYNNYHRHDHYGNIRTPDVIVKPQDYIDRILELGHTNYFTTNHGCSGNVFEAYDLCKKNNLKLIYGMEMYYVDDRFVQDKANYHIIVIGLTRNAFHEINRISSEANKTGYYYKPRVDMQLLLSLPKDEVVITTSCIASRLFKTKDYEEKFVIPLKKHFGNNFLLEVQSHPDIHQANYNKKILELSDKYNLKIIHANDSHYIYPEQSKDRLKFLNGKGMNYGEEDSFILDYPDTQSIFDRYKQQGVLSFVQVEEAIKNTLIFDQAEDLGFNKEIKMPSIYPNQDKNKKLREIIERKWNVEKANVNQDMLDTYKNAIEFELDIVEKTNMADYFLLNERVIDKAVNEYGAVLTKTGRGSAPSFYINKLLGFTDIDRVDSEVPLYATRFMSIARILETGSLPDIDFNFADVEPVIKASKDILGEDGIYYMIAYGTMQESAAFRNLCRAYKYEMECKKQKDDNGKILSNDFNKKIDQEIKIFNDEYNEVGKDLDAHRENSKWKKIIEESQKYIGVIDSISPSPCSFILLDKPVSTELGLIKVGEELCACIDGVTADIWKYLKNDYLTVSVWHLISETFKMLNKPIPSIRELKKLLDDKVWKLYEEGLTATLNQADSDFATNLVKKYSPTSIAEISAWVAAIRPGFASLLNNFLNRETYSTGIKELDEVLKDSFHYLLYQESIMKFLVWCGIKEDETYDIIKKIAKKKFKEEELKILKGQLVTGFKNNTGSEEGFNEVWQVVEDAAHYSFNASHSLSVAYDSLYGGYLKANFPLEYYAVVLNHYEGDTDKTKKITDELAHFNIELKPIKFRNSRSDYTIDKMNNCIYKAVSSVKFMNKVVTDELYELRNRNYNTFIDLLYDITNKTSCNSRQLEILIKLDFFSEFGKAKKLLKYVDYYNQFANAKVINKNKIDSEVEEVIKKYSRETNSQYRDLDNSKIMNELCKLVLDEDFSIHEKINAQQEFLGYVDYTNPKLDKKYLIVLNLDTKFSPKFIGYCLNNGKSMEIKVYRKPKRGKKNPKIKTYFEDLPFVEGDMLYIKKFEAKPKSRKTENGYEPIPGTKEWWITDYIKPNNN